MDRRTFFKTGGAAALAPVANPVSLVELPIYSPDDVLPPKGKYVLIRLDDPPYDDKHDPEGVKWAIAVCKRGISKAEREALPNNSKRKLNFKGADEDRNNQRPYRWEEFGPSTWFGQDVLYWMPLPRRLEQ